MKSFVHSREVAASRQGAGQLAYTEIRRLILHGELPAGTLLGEEDLAGRIEVSRTPVREALRALLREGLVVEGPRRQVVVARMSESRSSEVESLREVAERFAVDAALEHGLEVAAIDQLRLILIRQRRAMRLGDIHEFLDCDDEFHIHLATAAGLELTADLIRQTTAFARLVLLERGVTIDEVAPATEDHEVLIDQLEAIEAKRTQEQKRTISAAQEPSVDKPGKPNPTPPKRR